MSVVPPRAASRETVIAATCRDDDVARARLCATVWGRSALAIGLYREGIALGRALGALGVTPDALTYASLALAALAGVAAAAGRPIAAACLVLVSGICDVLDGVVARATGRATPFGALLDSTIDRLADGLPLLGLVVFYAGSGPAVLAPGAALLASLTVSYVRARAESLGATLPPLFMRRAERVVMLAGSLLVGAIPLGGPVPAPLTLVGVALIAVLAAVGAASALRAARALLGAPGRS
jgi:CDP-diacylglycerol--glycerol-3-phosphate 3-phosphatidyltransferase